MDRFDLIVRGGNLVSEAGVFQVDVCVHNGCIAALTQKGKATADRVIDAEGKLVLPGVIDAHVHMQIMQQGKYPTADTFESGSRAAAAGGVTTMLDFFSPENSDQSLWEAFQARRALAEPQVIIDYGLHCAPYSNSELGSELDRLIGAGVTSFKLFQVYGPLALSDAQLFETLELIASREALATLHAENGQIADFLTERLRTDGKKAAIYHVESRPAFVEASCVQTAIRITEALDGNLYIVHLSCREGLAAVQTAQAAGVRVLAETCPQYLILDEEFLARDEGNLYLCTPPLRPVGHQTALWQGLRNGDIQVVATDHCAFDRQQKLAAPAFFEAPGGLSGIEFLLPILYSEGVCKGRLGISRLVQVLCHNPARVFGLAPRKGFLEPGSDADLVIFDPHASWDLTADQLHGGGDYTPYDGMRVQGRVEVTISRGEVIYRSGEVVGKPGRGQYLSRGMPDREVLEG